jgi:nucleotide-binding universal stress UspA family protein
MFKEILLPLDMQETQLSERAIAVAQEVAARDGARLSVITVIPDFGMPLVASYFPDDALERAEHEVTAELRRFIDGHFQEPAAVHAVVRQGKPHKAVVRYAREHGIDLIVMPARARDISKVLLGSSTNHVVERAPCSVLVVRP